MIEYTVDADGIATITWSTPGPVNTLSEASMSQFAAHMQSALDDEAVKGVIITSSKADFIAGADLSMLLTMHEADAASIFEQTMQMHALTRKMETTGKPVVAAINGTALGGGYEIALACHHRVAADHPKIKIGLPEVKLGLLPGGGGCQRLPRLVGIQEAMTLLTQGRQLNPQKALAKGLVDAVVPAEELLSAAKAWALANPQASQPWDEKRFKIPGGGVQTPKGVQTFVGANAMLRKETWGNYPAPKAILSTVYHGLQLPLDTALRHEARAFTSLVKGKVARNMISTLFFGLNDANKLKGRPADVPRETFEKIGVLGAGMMGAGIAYQAAVNGMQVVLLDRDLASAEKGKQHAADLLRSAVNRKKTTAEAAEATLGRITATASYADLEGCTLVVEAVFEDRGIKADVTAKTEAVIPEGAIFASNTSTLPITGLAEASIRPEQFIGLHFFSPVHKMPLVEIIVGARTSDATLARSMDFVKALKKTPIVVNDSRGFFTSRVFATYVQEGIAMVAEGVSPALIEHGGRLAGMPVGPLALADEVSLELMLRIARQTRADLGDDAPSHPALAVADRLAGEDGLGRVGKKAKAGFYEYPAGENKRLWSGLAEHFPLADVQPDLDTVKRRLLHIQAIESTRCLEEGVLRAPVDADIGSILGWGFCPFHGGVIRYIDTVGVRTLVGECNALAETCGPRFAPPASLVQMAESGERFYS
ncbi:MAG: 3-hydroxyacyl-CoA dehydrogenase NAD-binding domain-containing protein [Bradymonadia bacterium]